MDRRPGPGAMGNKREWEFGLGGRWAAFSHLIAGLGRRRGGWMMGGWERGRERVSAGGSEFGLVGVRSALGGRGGD